MEELTPKVGPNLSDSPETPPETAQVFGYDVASQFRAAPPPPNPNSPLAAGWLWVKRKHILKNGLTK